MIITLLIGAIVVVLVIVYLAAEGLKELEREHKEL